jgi:hypothetical protein
MGARFGKFKDGGDGRVIFRKQLRSRNYLHFRAVGQHGVWRQHHHAILDFASESHALSLTLNQRQSNPKAKSQTATRERESGVAAVSGEGIFTTDFTDGGLGFILRRDV